MSLTLPVRECNLARLGLRRDLASLWITIPRDLANFEISRDFCKYLRYLDELGKNEEELEVS